MRYNLVTVGEQKNLTLFLDGEMYACDNSHPYWDEILDCLFYGDENEIPDLIDLGHRVAKQFEQITERVSVVDGSVTFDGDVIDNSLADAILRAMREGSDFRALALFMEKCYQNPRKHSRENLYDWLSTHEFTITPSGDLVGYKGVSSDLTSKTPGPGIVNGKPVTGHLDNSVGNVLEIARSEVEHNPAVGCSVGLHVGTWDYASSFGAVVVKVIVNPRDVVSVPTDCSWAKMRVCRYKVVEVIDNPVTTLIDPSWDDDWDE